MVKAFDWTPERVERAMELHGRGVTLSKAAAEIGVSRKTLMMMIHKEERRLGLRQPVEAGTVKRRSYTTRKAIATLSKARFMLKLVAVNDKPQRKVGILNCTGCKWPMEPDETIIGGFVFCNAPKDDARYCAFHRKISGVPVMPRHLHLSGVRR